MKTLKLAAVITALVGSMNANAAGTIDLFSSLTSQSVTVNGNDTPGTTDFNQRSDSLDPGSILGGFRDIEVELISGDGNPANTANMNVFGGNLSFSAASGLTAKGTIQWDGNDNLATLDTNGLGGVDFLALGDAFNFEVISADLPFDFSIGLYDMTGNSVVFDLVSVSGPHTANIGFNFFTNAFSTSAALGGCGSTGIPGLINSVTCNGSGPLDMTKIGALEVVFGTNGGTTELDLKISALTAVPEPSSLALIGLGLMATGFASKRKSKKA